MNITNSNQMTIETYIEQYQVADKMETKSTTTSFKVCASQPHIIEAVANSVGMTQADFKRAGLDVAMKYARVLDVLANEHERILPILELVSLQER